MGKSYRDLVAWQKAMDLVLSVYQTTKKFPGEELYGLTSQVRRAIVSVPSNIAEGQGRSSQKEFLHHISIAYGSLMETETQLLIAAKLEYIPQPKADELLLQCSEVGKLLNGLYRSLSS